MAKIELDAELRTVTGKKVRNLRQEEWTPAILYGRGLESRPIKVQTKEAEEVVRQAGTSQLVTLNIAGEAPVQVIVRDLQRDVLRRNLLHVDLYQVEMTRAITVEVPLMLVNESPVIESGNGILLQGLQSVHIECLPGDLIDSIEVDIGVLAEVDQQITVGDLAIPSSIQVLSDLEEMVVRIARLEEVVEEAEEEGFVEFPPTVEPELIGRGREEEEEE
ncbi:MAG: 50S ribosomal protein L25 [Anaerolineae bacterium]|nr:50S ribosomal protein L25 [Anaerolineae bacterium]